MIHFPYIRYGFSDVFSIVTLDAHMPSQNVLPGASYGRHAYSRRRMRQMANLKLVSCRSTSSFASFLPA